MSALPLKAVPSRTARTEQNRQAKQRERAKAREAGLATFHITLPADQAQQLAWLRTAQSGDVETFFARALVTGAKFVYNSGNVRGGKRRIKG
ncbi:MAG: hypothetical protein P4L99_27950 [Chthoniobacter sp.]|nr:hypothetical protein [Chthoniobacter sp.]